MTENKENLKARDAIRRKIIGNAQNRTCQNHCRATLTSLTKVIIKARYTIKIRAIEKGNLSNYAQN